MSEVPIRVRATEHLDYRLLGPEGVIAIDMMSSFALLETRELKAELALTRRKFDAAMKGLEHYGDEMNWDVGILTAGGTYEDALYLVNERGYDHARKVIEEIGGME